MEREYVNVEQKVLNPPSGDFAPTVLMLRSRRRERTLHAVRSAEAQSGQMPGRCVTC